MEKPTSDCSSCGTKTNFCSAVASGLWKTQISKTLLEVTLDVSAFSPVGHRFVSHNRVKHEKKTTKKGATITVWPV